MLMLYHKGKHFGSDFQVLMSSADQNSKSRLVMLKDVKLKITSPHCQVPLWQVPYFFGSCPQPLSSSSQPSMCTNVLSGACRTRNTSLFPYRNSINDAVAEGISVVYPVLFLKNPYVPRLKVSGFWCRGLGDTQKSQAGLPGVTYLLSHSCS